MVGEVKAVRITGSGLGSPLREIDKRAVTPEWLLDVEMSSEEPIEVVKKTGRGKRKKVEHIK